MWNDWFDTSPCSKTCGYGEETGSKTQRRTKNVDEAYGGICDNVFTQTVPCTTNTHCPSK